ncbi:MAG: recombinase family protein [Defluviitaleaceae bacterium]|nr:recombinase family protein [Defluviitaleaceae bacterium]
MIMEQKITALYCRLSQDDEKAGDSMSIQNQKLYLADYADRNGLLNPRFFIDDGFTGVDFERREGFQEMLREINAGNVATVVTKDLSRLGRNYLRTGELIEIIFPEKGVRYIAINDNVDTLRDDNAFTPLQNWINEFYARDTSKKIKATKKAQAERGERVNGHPPPYGFRIDPENRHRLIIDHETAHIVQQIFTMYAQGARICQIQAWLATNEVLVPAELHYQRNEKVNYKRPPEEYIYRWSSATLYGMLARKEYIGHTVTNKTTKVSYKSKKKIKNTEAEQYIFENTHEPIIDEALYEQVRKRLGQKQRPAWNDELDIFSGILFCADCGMKLHVMRGEKLPKRKHAYNCRSYRNRKRVRNDISCTSHYIRKVVLEELVLTDIQRVSVFAENKKAEFIQRATEYGSKEATRRKSAKRKKLESTLAQLDEIDKVFRRVYKDMVMKRISEESYNALTSGFDKERQSLTTTAKELQQEVEKHEIRNTNAKKFIDVVKKFTDIKELTYELVHEFIDKIIVHEVDRETNTRYIEIHYNFVGQIDSGDEPTTNECYMKNAPIPRKSIAV